MKGSLYILLVFSLGLILGYLDLLPNFLLQGDNIFYVLIFLLFSVGLSIGLDENFFVSIKKIKKSYLILPFATIAGTLSATLIGSLFIERWSTSECLAVASGFGYYSLSSILIIQEKGAELGSIALLANIIRELICLLFAPLIVKITGPLSLISIGGATTMDTALPVIIKYSGQKYAVVSIFHGFVVDFSVAFLVGFFISF